MKNEWNWEGNVVKRIVEHLRQHNWRVTHIADTKKRARGIDIEASRLNKTLLVEVKGYPSKYYQRGPHKGQEKPTSPPTQARHWFAEALLTSILRKADNPEAKLAIGLPEARSFSRLVDKARYAFSELGITIFVVKKTGKIVEIPRLHK